MAASNTVKAGAAYEAVLVDNVTGKVDQIIKSLGRLEQAFKSIKNPAQDLNRSMNGIGAAMELQRQRLKRKNPAVMLGRSFQRTANVITTASQAIGQAMIHIGNEIRMIGIAATGAGASMSYFLLGAVKGFAGSQQILAQFNETFGESAEDMNAWVENLSTKFGTSLTKTRSSLLTFRDLMADIGDPGTVNEMAKAFEQLALDMSAAKDITREEARVGLRAGLLGQHEQLSRRGINVLVGNIEEYVNGLDNLNVKYNELTASQKMAVRWQYILSKARELKWMGAAAREADTYEQSVERLSSAWENFRNRVGSRIYGIVTKAVRGLTAGFKSLEKVVTKEFVERFAVLALGLTAVGSALIFIGTALTLLGPPLLAAGTALASFFGMLGALLAAAAIGSAALSLATFGPAGIMAGNAALLLFFGTLIAKGFPAMRILEDLGDTLDSLAQDTRDAVNSISTSLETGDWENAWETVTIAGELAFLRLGNFIMTTIRDSIESAAIQGAFLAAGWMRLTDRMIRQGPLNVLAMEAALVAQAEEAKQIEDQGLIERAEKRIAELERRLRLRGMIGRATIPEATRPGEEGGGSQPYDITKDPRYKSRYPEPPKPGDIGRSMALMTATAASIAGRTGPGIDPVIDENKKQTEELKNQTSILGSIETELQNQQPEVF